MPEYDNAVTALAFEIIQAIAWSAPVLAGIEKAPVSELPQDSAPPDVAHGAVTTIKMQSQLTESIDSVLTADVDAWVAMVAYQGEKAGEALEKEFFKFMERVTTESGQVVDGRGQPLSHDLILDVLEKLAIDFDAHGSPEMPTIVAHPDSIKSLGEPTPAQLKRRDEIIERKRREFLARRRVRKLD